MATSLSQQSNVLQYGVKDSMPIIAADYNHSMLVFCSLEGVSEALRHWSHTMQRVYNRNNQYRLNDITIIQTMMLIIIIIVHKQV
jgi:hypothetical protein